MSYSKDWNIFNRGGNACNGWLAAHHSSSYVLGQSFLPWNLTLMIVGFIEMTYIEASPTTRCRLGFVTGCLDDVCQVMSSIKHQPRHRRWFRQWRPHGRGCFVSCRFSRNKVKEVRRKVDQVNIGYLQEAKARAR